MFFRDRTLPLQGLMELQGPVEVLRVKPSSHHQHRRLDLLQVGSQIPALPECVIAPMGHDVVPEGNLIVEIQFVGVGEGAHLQEEGEPILGAVLEGFGPLGGGPGSRATEVGDEVEEMGQPKGPVPMEIIPRKPVHDRSLG
jgi:hypothetical protein